MFNWTLIYLIRLKCAGFFDKIPPQVTSFPVDAF